MLKKLFGNSKLSVFLLSVLYALVFFSVYAVSPRTAAVAVICFVIILIIEPWTKFARRYLRIGRLAAVIMGLVFLFLFVALVVVFLVPVVVREASNFYSTVLDFFPSDTDTPVSIFEINANIDRISLDEGFVQRLGDDEREQLADLSSELKSYYQSIYEAEREQLPIPVEQLKLALQERGFLLIAVGDAYAELKPSYDSILEITRKHLTEKNALVLANRLMEQALIVPSKEIWRDVVEAIMPKTIDEGTRTQILDTVRRTLLELQIWFRGFSRELLEKVPAFLSSLGSILFFVILGTIYFSYYFPSFKRFSPHLYPKSCRSEALTFLKDTYRNLERFVTSIVLVSIFVGVIVAILVRMLGLPYSLLMGFWATITNMIPIVGVVFEIIPLILLAVSARSLLVFVGLLAALLIIHTAAFIVFLKLMRGHTRTNPVIMIFAIIFFGQVLGIVGAFLAVPLTIILKQFWEHFISPWFERDISGKSS